MRIQMPANMERDRIIQVDEKKHEPTVSQFQSIIWILSAKASIWSRGTHTWLALEFWEAKRP